MPEEIAATIVPGCPSRVIVESEEEKATTEALLARSCGVAVEVEEASVATEAEYIPVVRATAGEDAVESGQVTEQVCDLEPDKPWNESICGKLADAVTDQVIARLRKEWLEARATER